jgi:hypothetical protein
LCAAPPVSTPAAARSSAPGSAGRAAASNVELGSGRAGHLEAVAQQAEPGDVGRTRTPAATSDLGRGPVERSHLVDRAVEIVGRRLALAATADQDPVPAAS